MTYSYGKEPDLSPTLAEDALFPVKAVMILAAFSVGTEWPCSAADLPKE